MKNRLLTILFLLLLALFINCATNNRATVTIKVKADNLPPGSGVYVAGNLARLGLWGNMRHMPLALDADSLWCKSIEAEIGSEFAFKITRGDWRTEAVDSSGFEFPNYTFMVKSDTTIQLQVSYWRDISKAPPKISTSRFQKKGWTIELWDEWLFKAGDDSSWAAANMDDADWQPVDSRLGADQLPESWQGNGWFRLHLDIDSSIVLFPLALFIEQQGAAEIYLDGKNLYTIGQVADSRDNEKVVREREPKPLVFSRAGEHVLAVRYSNFQKPLRFLPGGWRGFSIWLGHLDMAIEKRVEQVRWASKMQLVFSVIPLSFALMHLLLFVFYPQFKNNLYYALSMTGFAGMVIAGFSEVFSPAPQLLFWIILSELISTIFAIAFGVMAVYSTIYKKMPRTVFLPFVLMSAMTLIVLFLRLSFDIFQIIMYILLALAIFDMIRLTFISGKLNKEWGWIISAGFTVALLIFAYQALIGLGLLQPIGGEILVWMYSIPVVAISLSIHISLNFSKAHKELQVQLKRVQQLSEEKIASERKAQEEEIQRRLLEADNARKTQELEEARQLQLSMLPKKVPQLPGIEIAVSMKTATEVGGDYYDFHTNGQDSLTLAIGDATGHGMKAGTMVAVIKSLFSAYRNDKMLKDTLDDWSQIIRQMNLGNLYMAMALLSVQKNQIRISNAGMPPALLYRTHDKAVQEIILKSMPLGGAANFVYDEQTFSIERGDTLLLMSDGFIELFNEQSDMYDLRTISAFQKVAHRSASDIVDLLNQECSEWRGERPQNDDVTFVAVKFS